MTSFKPMGPDANTFNVEFVEHGKVLSGSGAGEWTVLASSSGLTGRYESLNSALQRPTPRHIRGWRFYSPHEFTLALIAYDNKQSLLVAFQQRGEADSVSPEAAWPGMENREVTQTRFLLLENKGTLTQFEKGQLPYTSLLRLYSTVKRSGEVRLGLETYSSQTQISHNMKPITISPTTGDDSQSGCWLWTPEGLSGKERQLRLILIAHLFIRLHANRRLIIITGDELDTIARLQLCEALQILFASSGRILRFAMSHVTRQNVDIHFAYPEEPCTIISGGEQVRTDQVIRLSPEESALLEILNYIFDPKERAWSEALSMWNTITTQLRTWNSQEILFHLHAKKLSLESFLATIHANAQTIGEEDIIAVLNDPQSRIESPLDDDTLRVEIAYSARTSLTLRSKVLDYLISTGMPFQQLINWFGEASTESDWDLFDRIVSCAASRSPVDIAIIVSWPREIVLRLVEHSVDDNFEFVDGSSMATLIFEQWDQVKDEFLEDLLRRSEKFRNWALVYSVQTNKSRIATQIVGLFSDYGQVLSAVQSTLNRLGKRASLLDLWPLSLFRYALDQRLSISPTDLNHIVSSLHKNPDKLTLYRLIEYVADREGLLELSPDSFIEILSLFSSAPQDEQDPLIRSRFIQSWFISVKQSDTAVATILRKLIQDWPSLKSRSYDLIMLRDCGIESFIPRLNKLKVGAIGYEVLAHSHHEDPKYLLQDSIEFLELGMLSDWIRVLARCGMSLTDDRWLSMWNLAQPSVRESIIAGLWEALKSEGNPDEIAIIEKSISSFYRSPPVYELVPVIQSRFQTLCIHDVVQLCTEILCLERVFAQHGLSLSVLLSQNEEYAILRSYQIAQKGNLSRRHHGRWFQFFRTLTTKRRRSYQSIDLVVSRQKSQLSQFIRSTPHFLTLVHLIQEKYEKISTQTRNDPDFLDALMMSLESNRTLPLPVEDEQHDLGHVSTADNRKSAKSRLILQIALVSMLLGIGIIANTWGFGLIVQIFVYLRNLIRF